MVDRIIKPQAEASIIASRGPFRPRYIQVRYRHCNYNSCRCLLFYDTSVSAPTFDTKLLGAKEATYTMALRKVILIRPPSCSFLPDLFGIA